MDNWDSRAESIPLRILAKRGTKSWTPYRVLGMHHGHATDVW